MAGIKCAGTCTWSTINRPRSAARKTSSLKEKIVIEMIDVIADHPTFHGLLIEIEIELEFRESFAKVSDTVMTYVYNIEKNN